MFRIFPIPNFTARHWFKDSGPYFQDFNREARGARRGVTVGGGAGQESDRDSSFWKRRDPSQFLRPSHFGFAGSSDFMERNP